MVLNYIWIAFFVIALIFALIGLAMGDTTIFQKIVDSTFDSSKNAFEISLGRRRARPLAWHHEDWREGGSCECVGKSTQPGLHPSLPRYSEERSGDGKHLHEYRFEYAGTR